jgi:septal ring factor EnvC (AmiA/AmiB activator)
MIVNRTGGRMSDDTRKERMAAYRRLQSEYLIIEQDIRKKRRNHEALVAEIRKLKMDLSRMEASLREKTTDEAKLVRELGLSESEWGRIRRRMNMLA